MQLTRLRDGTRRVTHITEVQGMEGDVITLQDIFLFDFGMGVDEHGRFLGHLKATGVRPKFAEKLADLGHPPRRRGVPARAVRPPSGGGPVSRRFRITAALLGLLTAFGIFVAPLASADTVTDKTPQKGAKALQVSKVDSTKPTAVKVTFTWNGEASKLQSLTLRQNGTQVERSAPQSVSETQSKRATVIVLDQSGSDGDQRWVAGCRVQDEGDDHQRSGSRPVRDRHVRVGGGDRLRR